MKPQKLLQRLKGFGNDLWSKTAVAIAMNLDRQSVEVAALERLLALSYSAINSVIRKQLKAAEEPIYQCQHPPSKLGSFQDNWTTGRIASVLVSLMREWKRQSDYTTVDPKIAGASFCRKMWKIWAKHGSLNELKTV